MDRRICVVGGGRWGRNHIRTLSEMGCLGGIVETDDAARRELADKYSVTTYPSITEAVGDSFDGFTICTPAATHAELAEYLIRRGRHVLVEKPLALNVGDANNLARLASQFEVTLMVGHLMLFHPAIRKMKSLMDSGKIGKTQYLYSNRLNLGAVRTEENILWSFAPHDISIFQYFVGTQPIEMLSRGGAFLQSHLHDTTMTLLRYDQNVVGHIFVSWLHPFKEHRLVVIGSKGMLVFEDASSGASLVCYEKGIDWVRGEPVRHEGPSEIIDFDSSLPLKNELQYFIEHLGGDKVEIAGPDNAIEVLEILERATQSLCGLTVEEK